MYSQAKQAAYANLETTTSLEVTFPLVTQEFERRRFEELFHASTLELSEG